MADKKSFIMYEDWGAVFEQLPAEDCKELILGLFDYASGSEPETDSALVNLALTMMTPQLDRDSDKYQQKVERMAKLNENKKRNRNEIVTEDTTEEETEATSTRNRNDNVTTSTRNRDEIVRDNVNVNDNDNVNVNDTPKGVGGNTPTPARTHVREPLGELDDAFISDTVGRWNSIGHATKISRIAFGTRRYDELRVCVGLVGHAGIQEAIHRIRDSEYLRERGNVNFDSYMNRNAIQKVLEGNYDKTYKPPAKEKPSKSNSFNNFPQRDYDMDELGKKLLSVGRKAT